MAVDQWRHYLLQNEFVIHTDHRSLVHLNEQRLHTPWQQKAFTKLLGLNYRIQYRRGVENCVADALSRRVHQTEVFALSSPVHDWLLELQHGTPRMKRLRHCWLSWPCSRRTLLLSPCEMVLSGSSSVFGWVLTRCFRLGLWLHCIIVQSEVTQEPQSPYRSCANSFIGLPCVLTSSSLFSPVLHVLKPSRIVLNTPVCCSRCLFQRLHGR
jgi:hypothetical protein